VTRREHVQIGEGEKCALAFSGHVSGKNYSCMLQASSELAKFFQKTLALHERCVAADENPEWRRFAAALPVD